MQSTSGRVAVSDETVVTTAQGVVSLFLVGPTVTGPAMWLRASGRSTIWTSDQARLPAEFKHINKRRKRN